jgi:hypothetical protein
MQHQLHVGKTPKVTNVDFNTGWLIGILSVAGFAAALYVPIASGAPSFSEFASMSVFPESVAAKQYTNDFHKR